MYPARTMTLATLLLYAAAFVAFAAEPAAEPKTATQSAPPPTVVAPEATTSSSKRMIAVLDADGVQRAALTGGEFFLDPNLLVVKVNKPVELTIIKVTSYIPHNLIVQAPEAGIAFKIDFNAEKPVLIKFTPTKLGKYPMYCDKHFLFFKTHRERGMEGMIEVVE